MSATTILTDDTATTVVSDDFANGAGRRRFSWSAALAGAFVATAVTFFLLTLGTGFGLSLVTTPNLLHGAAPTFLTLGAVYFLVAQAFGFAAGGHIVGRLIGPAVETPKEEEFRAGAHGLAVWAIAVVATATMVAIAGFVAEGTAPTAYAASKAADTNSGLTPAATGYWVDMLFRGPAVEQQSSLAWRKYAQASSTVGTDASPAPAPSDQTTVPATDDESGAADQQVAPSSGQTVQITPATPSGGVQTTQDTTSGVTLSGRNVIADKAEAGRILDIGLANGGSLAAADRAQIARLISLDTGMTYGPAVQRVRDVEARIHDAEMKAAETARTVTRDAALWAALALLFGAIVSTMAAVSARWEDDRVSLFGRNEPYARVR